MVATSFLYQTGGSLFLCVVELSHAHDNVRYKLSVYMRSVTSKELVIERHNSLIVLCNYLFSQYVTQICPIKYFKVLVTCRSFNELTPWSRVFLKKLKVTQLVKKFLSFHGTQRFIIYSQQLATGFCPEPG